MASARVRHWPRCMKPVAATSSCRPGLRPGRARRGARGYQLIVLHGVGPDDVEAALTMRRGRASTRSSRSARWTEIAPDRVCDVMIDTGMNRLGIRPDELGRARRAGDRHAAQPFSLRRRGPCAECDAARAVSRCNTGGSRRSGTASPIPPGSALAATTASTSSGLDSPSTAASRSAEAESNIRQVARVECRSSSGG